MSGVALQCAYFFKRAHFSKKNGQKTGEIKLFQENKRASSTFRSSSFFKAFRPSGPPSNKISEVLED